MAANVFFVIIPGQRRMVAALREGRAPDPLDGRRGKQRSVHNNYFTLPVVFTMFSHHYAATYTHPQAWADPSGPPSVVTPGLGAGRQLRFELAWPFFN